MRQCLIICRPVPLDAVLELDDDAVKGNLRSEVEWEKWSLWFGGYRAELRRSILRLLSSSHFEDFTSSKHPPIVRF